VGIRAGLLRWAIVVAAGFPAGGCAHLLPFQDPDSVLLRVGSVHELEQAKPYAPIYTPYAIMAAKAYEDLGGQNLHPVTHKIDFGRQTQMANALLRGGWDYVEGGIGPLPCPVSKPDCNGFGIVTGGLEYQIWKRKGAVCREVVIAFRGTDSDSLDDWLANLRWFTRLLPIADEYVQVQAQISNIVAKIERYACYRPHATAIIATGHSLGGGLAQHAAYASGKISYVYAFDPSPVTGFFDISEIFRQENATHLPIDRVYEHGEVLAYVRYVLKNIFPPRPCDPQVRLVRFNALAGSAIAQHNMARLTEKLLNWTVASSPRPRVVPVLPVATPDDRIAAGCTIVVARTRS
jgi:hypothetical protein